MLKHFGFLLAAGVLAGCATDYSWRSSVPDEMRTIAVPTFRNESEITELGPVTTRQVLREFQREATFKIAPTGSAAVEVQGVVKSASLSANIYNRRSGLRMSAGEFVMEAEISVIDKVHGRILVNNKSYTARTTLSAGQDYDTAQRDASGRLADDLARQVVDDVLKLKW